MFLDFFTHSSGLVKSGVFWVYIAVSCCAGMCADTVKFPVTNETSSNTVCID